MCLRAHRKWLLLLSLSILIEVSRITSSSIKDTNEKSKGDGLHPDHARYDNYRIYHVELVTVQQVHLFQELEQKSDSCVFYGHARHTHQNLTILVAAHKIADFVDLLKSNTVKHRVLTYNFQKKIDENFKQVKPIDVNSNELDWNHYFHIESIYKWMESLVQKSPDYISIINIGTSTQGLDINGLKIARKPNAKTIFIESGIHAREWIAPATATFIINQLVSSSDPLVKRLGSDYNWIIFPIVNPDGYKFTFEGDRMWRKNLQLFGICRGVDLNRNYPNHWNSTESSGDPCRYDYAGPSAGSEVETQRIIKFLEENVEKEQIKTYLALHSFSQLIMFPYGYTDRRIDNYDDLTLIGQKASDKIKNLSGRVYKSGSIYETIYPSSGGSKDWAHGDLKIPITFTFELRGPPDSEDLFILPASEIIPTSEEAFAAITTIVQEAESMGYYK